jgi:hypothetical protein
MLPFYLTERSKISKLHLTETRWACSSVGERCPYKADVAGSIPATPTIFFPYKKTPPTYFVYFSYH